MSALRPEAVIHKRPVFIRPVAVERTTRPYLIACGIWIAQEHLIIHQPSIRRISIKPINAGLAELHGPGS
jgi:hypothetical protein